MIRSGPQFPPHPSVLQSDMHFLQQMTQRLLQHHRQQQANHHGGPRDIDIVFSTTAMPFPMVNSPGVPTFDEHNYAVADDIPQHGLSNEAIAAIPIHVTRGPAKKENCAICQNNFTSDRFHRILPCGHSFHPQCIGEWLSRSVQCPTCRNPVRK